MSQGKHLDRKAVRETHRRYKQGEESAVLAGELGCTTRALMKAYQRLGLERRGRGRPPKRKRRAA